jgi:hypothetical protein
MSTVRKNRQKKLAAALLGLTVLASGCGQGGGTVGPNGQPLFPVTGFGGGVNVPTGCAPVTQAVPFSGQVRVSPLNLMSYQSFGMTHPNSTTGPAPMQVGGQPQLSGGSTFTSSSAAGSLTLAVGIQNSNIPYQAPVQGVISFGAGGLAEIQSALGPYTNVNQACVTSLALFVQGTQGQDLVGPVAQICVRPMNPTAGGNGQVCGQMNF